MSTTEAVYATLLNHLQKFPTLKEDEKAILLRDCYTFMGSNFMKALSILEYTPHKVSIVEYSMFYIMIVEKQRFVLFKDRVCLNDPDIHKIFKFEIECNCIESWNRKVEKRAPFLCTHQILIYLIRAMKSSEIKIEEGFEENNDDLGELLLFLK